MKENLLQKSWNFIKSFPLISYGVISQIPGVIIELVFNNCLHYNNCELKIELTGLFYSGYSPFSLLSQLSYRIAVFAEGFYYSRALDILLVTVLTLLFLLPIDLLILYFRKTIIPKLKLRFGR